MKVSRIQLIKLINEVIGEVGELSNIIPVTITGKNFNTDQESLALFSLPTKDDTSIEGSIIITRVPPSELDRIKLPPVAAQEQVYNIGYDLNGDDTQYVKTDYKTLISILKAVAEFTIEHLSKVGGDVSYLIGATDKLSGAHIQDPQKSSLYQAIISKNLPIGWRAGNVKLDGQEIYYISNKK